ncbi:hypothetical protein J5N97_017340 [Dioscorea zingiberensis]|uniref:Uncharacterized protein n=1 Tax=Dioscorea zingiberensis TaxID=325984 RepID=A0A9D5HGA4_9LILI|nr:hypothetical protein J5N97_017340 [Dioscorea zingiberensis]
MAPKAEEKPAQWRRRRRSKGVAEKKPKVVKPPRTKDSPTGDKKKKKAKKGSETYKIYLFKVLKQVHPDIGISSKAMGILNSINDIFENLAQEASRLARYNKKPTQWSAIATHLPKRTDNEIKNYWNTHLKKRLAKMGIDPVTHKPKSDPLGCHTKNAANLSHMAQWESARLEAEARLVRESKLRSGSTALQTSNSSASTSAPPPAADLHGKATTPAPPPCLDVLRAWQGVASSSLAQPIGIDLESPTSTLSFSTGQYKMLATTSMSQEVDWKCFGKPLMRMAAGFSMPESTWLPADAASSLIGSDKGFCGMLLDNSSENAEAGSCLEEEQENNNYWDSILDLVNSSSPSDSPPVF